MKRWPAAIGRKFVCVCNGSRDDYQVPLALAEAGLLDRFVTDFYAPASRGAWLLPRFMHERRHQDLARRLTRSTWRVFAVHSINRFMRFVGVTRYVATDAAIDATLARVATRFARRRGSPLYCYHSYTPADVPPGVPLVVFAYHPTAQAESAAFARDAATFPESAIGFERERDMLARVPSVDWLRADAVVCASSFTAGSIIAQGCAPGRVQVIPYGCEQRRRDHVKRAAGAPAEFLFVGQGIVRKGLHHLIRAWQTSRRDDARLTIVSYRIDPAIAALIEDPSIRVLGYQTRGALDELFVAADVFVMPSLIEGFGLVYTEALSSGCHVIGTANTGLPDLNLTDDAVTLVGVGDVEALDRALTDCTRRARDGAFDRATIAAACARWTWQDFRRSIAAHAAAVLDGVPPGTLVAREHG